MFERAIILVDGSNMYHYVKRIGVAPRVKFDYKGFGDFLAKEKKVVSATYYIGVVRTDGTKKSQDMRANQQRLFAWLRVCGWKIEYGHMLKNDGSFKEKGVDVHMAVDMMKGAYTDAYDRAILVTSDTDLIPAIQAVKDAGKIVEYIGFSDRPSLGIIKHASETTLLKREDIEKFLP